jgi:hypothetical protein
MSEFVPPPGPESPSSASEPPAAAPEGRDGRPFIYAGAALIGLAFLLSWWSLTKYRVWDERGVPPEQLGNVTKDMDDDDKKEYEADVARYRQSWTDNTSQFGDFYKAHFGDSYGRDLDQQQARNFRSGTLYFRGWSTWTGWFGVTFVVLVLASQIAPTLAPQLEPWSWTFPWAGAALFGLYTLMALGFFFTVPSPNGDGYSQGVSWGNYLAILGGGVAVAGCVFEGLRAADRRIAALEAAGDEEDEPEEEPEPPPSPPEKPVKNRLQDW